MADYYAATFASAKSASDAVQALERAGVDRFRISYATPPRLAPDGLADALEGLRPIFHPDVGLTGSLLHMGFPEEAARMLTTAVEDGATLLVVIPEGQGRTVQRIAGEAGAQAVLMVDAAGFADVSISRPGGPGMPHLQVPQEDTHNPEAARALDTFEGQTMGDTTDHLGSRG